MGNKISRHLIWDDDDIRWWSIKRSIIIDSAARYFWQYFWKYFLTIKIKLQPVTRIPNITALIDWMDHV